MNSEEIFDTLLGADLTISQIKVVCEIAIKTGSNFKQSATHILDEIIPELSLQRETL